MKTLYADFKNEPLLDFSKEQNRKKMFSTLEKIKKECGREYPSIIGGKEYKLGQKAQSLNPAEPNQVVGYVYEASEELAEKAVQTALQAFTSWSKTPVVERANILRKVAKIFRDKRCELAAWEVFECGKQWLEADGDLGEAIDFLEYYACERERVLRAEKKGGGGGRNQSLLV